MSNSPDGPVAVHPFVGRDLRWLLETRAAVDPSKSALIWQPLDGASSSWTYRELLDTIGSVAAGLGALGVQKGSRVAIHLDNCPEFVFAWLGLLSMGAVAVSTNIRSSADELQYYLERSRAELVVTSASHLDTVDASKVLGPEQLVLIDDPDGGAPAGTHRFETLLRNAPRTTWDIVDPLAPAAVQFTSGTTARPKGVVWTQTNLLWGGRVSAAHAGLEASDRVQTFLPMFHTNAQIYSVMASLWVGATIILCPRFSTSAFWPCAIQHGSTFASVIPFVMRALRTEPVPDGHSFRRWGNSSIQPDWEGYFGIPTVAWWGTTETVTHGIVSELDSPRPPQAIGYPALEYPVRLAEPIVESDGSRSGLLEVQGTRGVTMALGYLDDEQATAAAWSSDGWYQSGDRVKLRASGAIEFLGRAKDMLRVGGENVAEREIERVIEGVAGVGEAAVVGRPDPMLDEVPVAFVVAGADASDGLAERVLEACRAGLAGFKIPREIHVVDDLPRGTLEKVSKATLRDMAGRFVDKPGES